MKSHFTMSLAASCALSVCVIAGAQTVQLDKATTPAIPTAATIATPNVPVSATANKLVVPRVKAPVTIVPAGSVPKPPKPTKGDEIPVVTPPGALVPTVPGAAKGP